jgi:hypothetical protein
MSAELLPLGTFVGARSGDKGGNANVGLWVVDPGEPAAVALAHGAPEPPPGPAADVALADARYRWLVELATPERIRQLLPETESLDVDVYALPNLRAVNIVIHGILGRGVAETSRIDPQAKGLGEHLRARLVEMPIELLGGSGS